MTGARARARGALLLGSLLSLPATTGAEVPSVPQEIALARDVPGTIMSVDAEDQILKVRHDRIPSLGWPETVTDFHVENRALLGEVYPGERVEFSLAKKNGRYVITDIHAVPPAM